MSGICKALLVEDTLIAQIAAKMILINSGCEVDVASTGKEALSKTKTNKYDLIFMDIGLEEGTDGFQVTKLIRHDSLNTETEIIILSAHSPDSYQDKMKELGILKFITKPLDPEMTIAIIDQIVNLKQALTK